MSVKIDQREISDSKIPLSDFELLNWETLIEQTVNYIRANDENYESAIKRVWDENRKPASYRSANELIKINRLSKEPKLDLGCCGLTRLETVPELFRCTHLRTLILSNEWGEYDGGNWKRKVSENKGPANNIKDLPEGFKRLSNLEVLICGGDWFDKKQSFWNRWGITKINYLGGLVKLKYLNLSNNLIAEIQPLKGLVNLQTLFLNNNNIATAAPIEALKELKELNLSNNYIANVEFLRENAKLVFLDLHSNLIRDLRSLKQLISSLDIVYSKWTYNSINVGGNDLQIPLSEVVYQGKNYVLSFFDRNEAEEKINLPKFKNSDIKLILVGNSSVGKSTLSHWLRKKEVVKNIGTTHWLEIKKWDAEHQGKRYNIRIFDFGGQEYYHDTHHLFFTNNTLYITLWDNFTNMLGQVTVDQQQSDGEIKSVVIQTYPLDYWLDSIKYFTQRRDKSSSAKQVENLLLEKGMSKPPSVASRDAENQQGIATKGIQKNILIVQNKVDSASVQKFINQETLVLKHPSIYSFCDISVVKERRLALLEETIFEIIDNNPLFGTEYLGTWAEIKKRLEENAETYNIEMALTDFKDHCNEIIRSMPQIAGKPNSELDKILFTNDETKSFAQYLNDIGVILFFPENSVISEKVFLNQNQILDLIYKVLLDVSAKNGEFNENDIAKSLKKDSFDEECKDAVALMIQFKIIFKHPSKAGTYIAPLYLPKEPSEGIKLFLKVLNKVYIKFEYQGFIHKNVLLDFFQSYGKHVLKEAASDDLYYWRDGVIIKDEKSDEIVLVHFLYSDENEKASVEICTLNKNNNSDFVNAIINRLDQINEGWEVVKLVSPDGQDYVRLDLIHEYEQKNNWIFSYDNKQYRLTDFKNYLKGILPMKNIFISYSKTDKAHLQKLENHLSILKRNGAIATWNCRKLLPGEKWDGKIRSELDKADIILFLVSDDFLATDYIWDVEIKRAVARVEDPNDKVTVVPIIVRACDWEESPLGVFNTAPKKAEVITLAGDIDTAWKDVVIDLKKIINN